jgi:hypothetical protein
VRLSLGAVASPPGDFAIGCLALSECCCIAKYVAAWCRYDILLYSALFEILPAFLEEFKLDIVDPWKSE